MDKITLITGANRGMGFELAKEIGEHGHHILVGARNQKSGEEAVWKLQNLGIQADFIQLDVTDKTSIQRAAKKIDETFGYLSILINNAGIGLDKFIKPSELSTDIMRKDFDVNFFGLIDVTQAMLPLLKKSKSAKIINMSSMMGSLTASVTEGYSIYGVTAVGYQASKSAVNMFTVQLAKEFMNQKDTTITVNAIDPGKVATEFGGVTLEDAEKMGGKSVEQGVARAVELAISDENTVTMTYSNAEGVVPW